MARHPAVRAACSNGAGANEDGIRGCAEEPHDEPVRLETTADLPATRVAMAIERDHAVECRHEVRDERRPIGAEWDLERGPRTSSEGLEATDPREDRPRRVQYRAPPRSARPASAGRAEGWVNDLRGREAAPIRGRTWSAPRACPDEAEEFAAQRGLGDVGPAIGRRPGQGLVLADAAHLRAQVLRFE
jgi:hypothetical protein